MKRFSKICIQFLKQKFEEIFIIVKVLVFCIAIILVLGLAFAGIGYLVMLIPDLKPLHTVSAMWWNNLCFYAFTGMFLSMIVFVFIFLPIYCVLKLIKWIKENWQLATYLVDSRENKGIVK
jgi:hypothetical protein